MSEHCTDYGRILVVSSNPLASEMQSEGLQRRVFADVHVSGDMNDSRYPNDLFVYADSSILPDDIRGAYVDSRGRTVVPFHINVLETSLREVVGV